MPPKKKLVKAPTPEIDESSSDSEVEIIKRPVQLSTLKQPSAFLKVSTGDSDRLQLASAINNLGYQSKILSDALNNNSLLSAVNKISELTNEKLSQLDIQIEARKQEYAELLQKVESEYKHRTKTLESDYHTKTKTLESDFKSLQIETKQKLTEFEMKACRELSSKNGMIVIEKIENDKIVAEKNQALKELKELKDTFNSKITENFTIERRTYEARLAQEKLNADLTHKAHTAELTAQVSQQIKEIAMLNKTIENLKFEIAEQRNLTREVATAGSKGAITQNIGKN